MNRMLARAATLALFAATALVACSAAEDRPACAASVPPPAPGPGSGSKPGPGSGSSKTTSSNTGTARTDTRPAPQKTATKPQQTSNGTWQRQEPRRVYKPQPAKVYVTDLYGQRYAQYPGFPGYYVIGVYPLTYGDTYGCTPAQVGEPVQDITTG